MPTKGTSDCDLGPKLESCLNAEDQWFAVSAGLMAGGGVMGGVGIFGLRFANRIGRHEGHDLADQHNAKLRAKHGLPALSQRAKRFQDVALAPYADAGGGGLTLAGRF